jgi:ATP-dependent DNA helicase RecG
MAVSEIKKLLKKGEGQTIEFKSSFNTDVIETLVAFANTSGGSIYLGVNDSGETTGIVLNKETVQNWINEIKNKTYPSITPEVKIFTVGKNIKIVGLEVTEFPVKPVSVRGRFYKRISSSNHLMRIEEITEEHLKTVNSSWDFFPDPNHSLQDIDIGKVRKLISGIERYGNKKMDFDPETFLSKYEFIRNNKITIGGYLLFAKDYCSLTDIQAGRFKSDTIIIDSISLNSDLITEAEEVYTFVRKHLMTEFIISGEPYRGEKFDYPPEAVREIVMNMIVHRDYRNSNTSSIKIFDNRIEFFNPGKLYGGISINDLLSDNYISQVRNKQIAGAFKESGLIERYGSGIKRVLTSCKNYGLIEPVFEEVYEGFRVTLYKKKIDVAGNVAGNVVGNVVGNEIKILEMIRQKPELSSAEIAVIAGLSARTVQRYMRKLVEKRRIRHEGPAKGGRWIVLK